MERADYYVGSVVALAIGVLLATLLWLSPLIGERPYRIEARFGEISGITERASVMLQGLEVGRVVSIDPEVGSDGDLQFRVTMSLRRRLANGARLPIVQGTSARLMPAALLGSASIVLEPPEDLTQPELPSGSVINGTVEVPLAEKLQYESGKLTFAISMLLSSAQSLLDSLGHTTNTANATLRGLGSEAPALIADLRRQLATTETLLATSAEQVGEIGPRLGAVIDSASSVLSDSRAVVTGMSGFVAESRPELVRVLDNMAVTSDMLQHIVRQVGERPSRLFSGVRMPPAPLPASAAPAQVIIR
jgi:ABC-type transporter Mla subunit MlaD